MILMMLMIMMVVVVLMMIMMVVVVVLMIMMVVVVVLMKIFDLWHFDVLPPRNSHWVLVKSSRSLNILCL